MHMHLLRPQDPSLALLIPTSVRVMQSAPSPSHSVQITVMIAAQSVTMSRGVLQTLVQCHQRWGAWGDSATLWSKGSNTANTGHIWSKHLPSILSQLLLSLENVSPHSLRWSFYKHLTNTSLNSTRMISSLTLALNGLSKTFLRRNECAQSWLVLVIFIPAEYKYLPSWLQLILINLGGVMPRSLLGWADLISSSLIFLEGPDIE